MNLKENMKKTAAVMTAGGVLGSLGSAVIMFIALSKIPNTPFENLVASTYDESDTYNFANDYAHTTSFAVAAGMAAGALAGAVAFNGFDKLTARAYQAGSAVGSYFNSERAANALGSSAAATVITGGVMLAGMTAGALEKTMVPKGFTGSVKDTAINHGGATICLAAAMTTTAAAIYGTIYGVRKVGQGISFAMDRAVNHMNPSNNRESEMVSPAEPVRNIATPSSEIYPMLLDAQDTEHFTSPTSSRERAAQSHEAIPANTILWPGERSRARPFHQIDIPTFGYNVAARTPQAPRAAHAQPLGQPQQR